MIKPLILVVEDDGTVRNLISTTLKSNESSALNQDALGHAA